MDWRVDLFIWYFFNHPLYTVVTLDALLGSRTSRKFSTCPVHWSNEGYTGWNQMIEMVGRNRKKKSNIQSLNPNLLVDIE